VKGDFLTTDFTDYTDLLVNHPEPRVRSVVTSSAKRLTRFRNSGTKKVSVIGEICG
jgi:hypothetical protein